MGKIRCCGYYNAALVMYESSWLAYKSQATVNFSVEGIGSTKGKSTLCDTTTCERSLNHSSLNV